MARFILIFTVSLFCVFCDPPKKTRVAVPGTATYGHQVLNMRCRSGSSSLTVSSKTALPQGSHLKPGDAVIIRGNSTEGSACLSNSGFQFQCEGVVGIDTHRAYTCQSGTITPTNTTALYSQNQQQYWDQSQNRYVTRPHQTGPIHIQSGLAMVYDNGTKFYVRLQFAYPSSYFAGHCLASYVCTDSY